MIAPAWPNDLWFVDLQWLLVDHPRCLSNLLHQPLPRVYHLDPSVYKLHAWKLSTNDYILPRLFQHGCHIATCGRPLHGASSMENVILNLFSNLSDGATAMGRQSGCLLLNSAAASRLVLVLSPQRRTISTSSAEVNMTNSKPTTSMTAAIPGCYAGKFGEQQQRFDS